MEIKFEKKHPLNPIIERNELKADLRSLTAKQQIDVLMRVKGFSHGKSKKKKGKKK